MRIFRIKYIFQLKHENVENIRFSPSFRLYFKVGVETMFVHKQNKHISQTFDWFRNLEKIFKRRRTLLSWRQHQSSNKGLTIHVTIRKCLVYPMIDLKVRPKWSMSLELLQQNTLKKNLYFKLSFFFILNKNYQTKYDFKNWIFSFTFFPLILNLDILKYHNLKSFFSKFVRLSVIFVQFSM